MCKCTPTCLHSWNLLWTTLNFLSIVNMSCQCASACVCVCASWPQMTNNIHVLYIICLKPKWRGEPLGKWQKLRFHPKMFQSLLYIIINVSFWRFHPKALPKRLNPGDSPNVSLRHCMWYVFCRIFMPNISKMSKWFRLLREVIQNLTLVDWDLALDIGNVRYFCVVTGAHWSYPIRPVPLIPCPQEMWGKVK